MDSIKNVRRDLIASRLQKTDETNFASLQTSPEIGKRRQKPCQSAWSCTAAENRRSQFDFLQISHQKLASGNRIHASQHEPAPLQEMDEANLTSSKFLTRICLTDTEFMSININLHRCRNGWSEFGFLQISHQKFFNGERPHTNEHKPAWIQTDEIPVSRELPDHPKSTKNHSSVPLETQY